MNNSIKTILSLLLFPPLGIYFYTKDKSISLTSFVILLIVGLILFIPLWTVISKLASAFENNVFLPFIANFVNK